MKHFMINNCLLVKLLDIVITSNYKLHYLSILNTTLKKHETAKQNT